MASVFGGASVLAGADGFCGAGFAGVFLPLLVKATMTISAATAIAAMSAMIKGSIAAGEPWFWVGVGVVPCWVGVGDVSGENVTIGVSDGVGLGAIVHRLVSVSTRFCVMVCCGVLV